jgi:zinc transporter ZupT
LIPEANEVLLEAIPDYPFCFALTGLGVILVLAVEQMTLSYISKQKAGSSHRHHSFNVELSRAIQSDKRTKQEKDSDSGSSAVCCTEGVTNGDATAASHDHTHVHNEVSAFEVPHDHSHDHQSYDAIESGTKGGSCGVHSADDNCCKEGLVHFGHTHAGCSQADEAATANGHDHQHNHDHSALVFQDVLKANSFRDMMTAYALELSTATHSVIIGVGLGASTSYEEVAVLLAAISFHQFLEGLGLGTMVANSRSVLGSWKVISFVAIFSMTVSIGILIGILTSEQQEEADQEITKGVFSSLAAGSMLYAALTEMTGQAFNRPDLEERFGLKTLMIIGYLLGFASMAVIGIWA